MNRMKKIMVMFLAVAMLMINVSGVSAQQMPDDLILNRGNTRAYSSSIAAGIQFDGDELCIICIVDAPISTTSISLLYVLREENAAGNLVIADTWSDGGTGTYFEGEYSYSPAIEGREYELSVRVGIYDEDGLVGYDYYTTSAVN